VFRYLHHTFSHHIVKRIPAFLKIPLNLVDFPKSPFISAVLGGGWNMDPPPEKEKLSLQPHAPTISVAAKALADKNIPVVEYGQQIQSRHGDPVVLLVSNKPLRIPPL
jgi:hypothetical protein